MQTRGPSGRLNVVVLEGASIVEEAEALNREWIEINTLTDLPFFEIGDPGSHQSTSRSGGIL